MEIEGYPYSFYFKWAKNPIDSTYTSGEDSGKIYEWLKENVIDENWTEKSTRTERDIKTYVYLKLKDDAIRFRLVWNAKIK